MTDICCIGHITHDRIVTPQFTTELNGGTSFYFSYAISRLPGVNYRLLTMLAASDMKAVDDMRAAGIAVDVIRSEHTVFFENKYGHNMNNRTQRVLAKSSPFTERDVAGVSARFVHLGSLLADDFSTDIIKALAKKDCVLSVDAQGFLRYVSGDKVLPCDWQDKRQALRYVDILKVNEFEIESLTGYDDPDCAARVLQGWGVREVLITLGSYGSKIYRDGKRYDIDAIAPAKLTDATGCGDTYMAGYLYKRSLGADIDECGRFAAAISSLKLCHSGPFHGSVNDVNNLIRNNTK